MKAIRLIKTRKGCKPFEKHDRYHVMFYGKFHGELYFNMTGYVGSLPAPGGIAFNPGEKAISGWRKEIAQLNREWAGWDEAEAHAPLNAVCEKCGRVYCDHEDKY